MNPLALAFLAAMSVLTLVSSRQNAIKALFAISSLLTLGQVVIILGLHFPFYRLMIAVGLCRVVARGEYRGFELNTVDKLFIACALAGVICGVLRAGSAEVFGAAYTSLGIYFVVRFLTKEPADILEHIRFMAPLVMAIGICMLVEKNTARNPFFVLGGVPAILDVRGDRVRCQGPFRSANTAGIFAAPWFALMIGLWFQEPRGRWRAVLGMIGCVMVIFFSNSSGPILCCATALIGTAMWKMRSRMSLFRRAIVVTIIGLALVMNAPVWYIIAKISDLVGGGGWHRAYIIDLAVNNFSSWWLIGTSETIRWAPDYLGLGVDSKNLDITNHFVAQGVYGGIWMFGLFIAIVVACFKIVGQLVDKPQNVSLKPLFVWSLGVTLAVHCVGFFSISYFDQIQVFWFWFLAVTSSLSTYAVRPTGGGEALVAVEANPIISNFCE